MDLKNNTCVPCEVGAPTVTPQELAKYSKEVPAWEVYDNKTKIKREFEFQNFREAIGFINKVADLAESEGHHPNIYLYDFKKVRVELWTHKIGGLHRNDFVMAAKIDSI
jgi:4a-hydroxytetrahydrobiopterin dehydratase